MTDISEVAGHVDLLRHARAEQAKWAEVEKAAKLAIVEAIGADTEGTIDGRVAVLRKQITTNRLDTKALKKERPDIVDQFTSPSVSTRIELAE
ncbi:hypothetical protein PBI_OMNICRON_53 [Mycobacterium phage Omnicron]|uniref:Uncharacterized protein n=1 Tax=Mycobacterium phage Omnicron TaxID=1541819 RepID=A0A088FV34_9CAUD|nr:hypothetical protein PBI_OMNICRON_53 [Mycobacterium phage Omnicron]AIM50386.1 hypothetical protein PBI_OMNICRON_53 [Mycobacterium phage Omnicron]